MLQLWLCTDRKKNTRRMLEEITDRAERGEKGMLLLVPEQFSHTMERQLCAFGGDRISRYAEVLGFSRLAARVFSEVGGCAETETDPSGRVLAMSLAARQVRARLKVYASCSDKPESLLQMLDAFDEFRAFCITPTRLREASASSGGGLAVKTEELALLMESYDAVCANMGQNPQTRLTRLLGALETCGFSRTIFFDGFSDFNGVEREIIAQLLQNGAQISVNLQCDGVQEGAQQYETARKTARLLTALAQKQQLPVQIKELPRNERETALDFLRERLFAGNEAPCSQEQDQVACVQGTDCVAECRGAVGEILRLTAEGARWRDISIACADLSTYRPILESLLRRAEIPAYYAGDTDILRHPIASMLISALQAATDEMEQEPVLAYLKSGFLPLSRDRCDRMENYALLWGLSGPRWKDEWTMNPAGVEGRLDAAELGRLNEDRALVIAPLCRLRDRLKTAKNTGEMVLALNGFLDEIMLAEQAEHFAKQCAENGDLQRAQEYVQVYRLLTTVMEQMYGVLGESVHTPEEFYRIFRTALSQCAIGTIPAKLDCVTVGSLMSQRRCDTAYVFLLGANEGSFPSAQTERSLLTDSERLYLLRLGIELAPTAAERLDLELAAIDSVLHAPEKRLYLGAVTEREAYLCKRAGKLFPDARRISEDAELLCRAEREYLSYLTRTPENIGALADAAPRLATRAREISDASAYRPGALREETVRSLYGKTLRLSSTKIDRLAGCRFAYFLEYGLRAEERKPATLDPMLYGTFVHDVLEHTAKQVMQEGGFAVVPLSRVLAITEERMEWYAQAHLADVLQTARSEYLFQRSFSEVRLVVTELYRELSVSQFEPKWFELKFAEDGTLPAVRIVGEKMEAELHGFVDRADIWRSGDSVYVRVIDYKTGRKSFDFSHVFYGLGLQMLLYLFALERTGECLLGTPLKPAGVLYFPARLERVSVEDRLDDEKTEKERREKQKRSGLLLDSAPVLQAMEPCEGSPLYLPYAIKEIAINGENNEDKRDKKVTKVKARVGSLATPEQLTRLERFVFRKVAELGDSLYSGEIDPNPYYFDLKDNACMYCPYQTVCRESPERRWLFGPKDAEAFWQRLEENDG